MADATDSEESTGDGAAPAPAAAAAPVASAQPPPSPEQLALERANKARADNLKKGRDAKAQKAADEKLAATRAAANANAEKTAQRQADVAEKPTVSTQTMTEGAKLLVKLCWLASKFVATLLGYQLRALSKEELHEGATEALPLLRRFSLVAFILSFLGFPLWLFSKVQDLAERIVPSSKPPEQLPPNVHKINGGSP